MSSYFLSFPEPRPVRPRGVVDIVVCVDCTGSMAPCIDGLKNHIAYLFENLTHHPFLAIDWRARLLVFRDLTEDEPIIETSFTNDIETLREALAGLRAGGGGTLPESTLDAIYRAVASDWRKGCNRCVVVFTDAPCHPELHVSSAPPSHHRDVEEVINRLCASRARVFLFAPQFDIYADLAKVERVIFDVVESKTGLGDVDFYKIMAFVASTISASTEPVLIT